MHLLILAVFCVGVNANKYQSTSTAGFRPGLPNLCNKYPIEENAKCCTENIERDPYCIKFGNCLIDNEEEVNNEENLVYPCADNDIECVRQFFAKNCLCQPRQGPATDPICVKQSRQFMALANITIIGNDIKFMGLSNATIKSFYTNKKTGYLVLTIEVPVLEITQAKLCYVYHRLGKESIIRCDTSFLGYKSVQFTAEIPGVPKCRLDDGTITGYILDSSVVVNNGPNIFNSTDPAIQEATATRVKSITDVLKENFIFRAAIIMTNYIESNICDFDINKCYI